MRPDDPRRRDARRDIPAAGSRASAQSGRAQSAAGSRGRLVEGRAGGVHEGRVVAGQQLLGSDGQHPQQLLEGQERPPQLEAHLRPEARLSPMRAWRPGALHRPRGPVACERKK